MLQITVKAGTCQREFASLNANYETVKQDVNNFAQELSTSKGAKSENGQQNEKAVKAGRLWCPDFNKASKFQDITENCTCHSLAATFPVWGVC